MHPTLVQALKLHPPYDVICAGRRTMGGGGSGIVGGVVGAVGCEPQPVSTDERTTAITIRRIAGRKL
jgi:hypothetical protein